MSQHESESGDVLLALIGEPIVAFPQVWTLQQWWEWHARLTREVIAPPAPEPVCACVGYTIRTDYGTGVEHDVDRSSCPIHEGDDDA